MSSSNQKTFDLIIQPGQGFGRYWQELWRYRGLFYFLAWRDLLVRYKQTVIGVAWSLLRPLLTLLVFSVIFGRLAGFPSEGGAPYPILVFAALLPWQLVANGLTDCSNSLIANANLLSKVYFPRLVIPASAVIVSLVDFFLSCAVLFGLMVWYQFVPGWRLMAFPLFLLLALSVVLGAGIWLAALNVKFRDFRYIVPVMVQFGLYVSPVGFSSAVVPDQWRIIYSLNPLVGVIDGFRWSILGGDAPLYWPSVFFSVVFSLVILAFGFFYFRKVERAFADII